MKKILTKLLLVLLVCALMMTVVACEHTHQYTETITKQATCSEKGVKTFTCSCGDTYTEEIEKLAHTEQKLEAVAPDCDSTGLTEGKKCSVCGEILVAQQEISATGHAWDNACDTSCNNNCGETREPSHTPGEAVVENEVAPDCENEGSYDTVVYCSVCDAEISRETTTVEALGHKDENKDHVCDNGCDVAQGEHADSNLDHNCDYGCAETIGTCEDKDLDHNCDHGCKVVIGICEDKDFDHDCDYGCDKVYGEHKDSATDADHKCDYGCGEVLEDCSDKDNDQDHNCDVCNKADVTAHAWQNATCTAPKTCSECGATEGEALGHAWDNACDTTCNNGCGETRQPSHTEDEGTITTPATCKVEGVKTFKCSVCGETLRTETVAKADHDVRIQSAVEATCTSEGKTEGRYCFACSEVFAAQTVVPKLSHTYDDDTDLNCNVCGTTRDCLHAETTVVTGKPATCTEPGLTNGTKCTVCGDIVVAQQVIEATGHQSQAKIPAVEPTCTEPGSTEGLKCMDCGTVLTQPTPIQAKGHSEKTLDAVPATCTKTGLTEGKQCTVCQTITKEQEIVPTVDHTYSNNWSTDGTQHWHACTACGAKADLADHAFTTEVENSRVDATCDVDGKYTLQCKCGVTKDVTISATGHSYSKEWTQGDDQHWHECSACGGKKDVTDHSYDNACDADCNECGATRTPSAHKYDNACDTTCNVCGDVREVEPHVYDNACDADCNECGATRVPADHVYDNNCDVDCNVCKETREVGDHVYENDCDADCNECGATREPSAHVYDNACDTTCNVCGDVREVEPHVYDNACDTDCNECSDIREVEPHVYNNACDADCNECGDIREVGDHVYDNACDADCNECGATREPSAHVYDNACDTTCNECGDVREVEPHVYDNDCDVDCNVCGATRVPADHVYTDDYDTTCDVCGDERVIAPSAEVDEVSETYDLLHLANKQELVIDLAKNVQNPSNFELTYSATLGGEAVTLNGSTLTVSLETYNATLVTKEYVITVSFVDDEQEQTFQYTYILGLKDSTSLSMANGGFEDGLDGWKVIGNIGSASTDTHYWLNDPESAEGFAFGMDGTAMFSAYAPGATESAVGTLTSPTFTLAGNGFVTFKVGAMRDGNYVYVDVVDASTGEILARYYNGLWTEEDSQGCKLVAYKADLSAFEGKTVFFRISDNADSGYGLFFADSFITYYEVEPTEGFNTATKVGYDVTGTIYDVFNGGFEMGSNQGWWNNGEIGVVTNANGYWADNIAYGKDGDHLFTGVESFGADTMREGNKGTLTSSAFELGGTGWISYKLGGGGSEFCYVQVLDAVTGEVLARFRQQAQQDAVLIQYVADLSAHVGKTVRFQVVDYASSGWGCVSFDSLVTYYPTTDTLPAGETANNIFHGNYNVTNGSFENGLDGWTMNIWEAGAQNTLGWVESSEHDAGWYTKNDDRKDGNNLFTFCRPDGTNCENTKGELVSSTFTLKQNGYVSFRFGGAGSREVRIELVRADGTVIATFYNEAPGKANTEMYAYYYQYTGETADCFFRVVDDSVSNYGCFVVDDFRANLDAAPEGFIQAIQ